MEWNTETQRHRVLFFFERTEFTEQKFGSMAFAYFIYLFLRVSASLCSIQRTTQIFCNSFLIDYNCIC